MEKIISLAIRAQQTLLSVLKPVDFIPPLLLRLYLVPIFWMAGTKKLAGMEDTIAWFGNPDWGLGLPAPALMAYLATFTEIFGAIALTIGLATRWMTIPLMFTMFIAMITVHAQNGWLAIAEGSGFFASDRTIGAIERLDAARSILQEYGNYDWLTQNGPLVILNNGVEFAVTYTLMLLAILFMGPGKASIDHLIKQRFMP